MERELKADEFLWENIESLLKGQVFTFLSRLFLRYNAFLLSRETKKIIIAWERWAENLRQVALLPSCYNTHKAARMNVSWTCGGGILFYLSPAAAGAGGKDGFSSRRRRGNFLLLGEKLFSFFTSLILCVFRGENNFPNPILSCEVRRRGKNEGGG